MASQTNVETPRAMKNILNQGNHGFRAMGKVKIPNNAIRDIKNTVITVPSHSKENIQIWLRNKIALGGTSVFFLVCLEIEVLKWVSRNPSLSEGDQSLWFH